MPEFPGHGRRAPSAGRTRQAHCASQGGHIKRPVRFRSDSQDEFPHGPDTLPQQPGLGEEVASAGSLQKLGGKVAAKPFRRIRRAAASPLCAALPSGLRIIALIDSLPSSPICALAAIGVWQDPSRWPSSARSAVTSAALSAQFSAAQAAATARLRASSPERT